MSVRDGIASLPRPTGKKYGKESRAGRTYRAFSSNPARNHPDNGLGGNFRLTFEYTDPIDQLGKPDEKCIGISLDQEIGGGVIPFFRYTWTQGNVTNVKYLVATGFGFSGPLGRTNDFAGIAGSWGRAATDGHQS
jgi:hypothetical protein